VENSFNEDSTREKGQKGESVQRMVQLMLQVCVWQVDATIPTIQSQLPTSLAGAGLNLVVD